MTEKYLSIQDAADLLGIDYATARRWIRDGKLPGEMVANRAFAVREGIEEIAAGLEGTMSIREVAERINRAPRTVYWLLTEEKRIEGFVWMRRWYIYEESVNKYLKDRGPDSRSKPKGYR